MIQCINAGPSPLPSGDSTHQKNTRHDVFGGAIYASRHDKFPSLGRERTCPGHSKPESGGCESAGPASTCYRDYLSNTLLRAADRPGRSASRRPRATAPLLPRGILGGDLACSPELPLEAAPSSSLRRASWSRRAVPARRLCRLAHAPEDLMRSARSTRDDRSPSAHRTALSSTEPARNAAIRKACSEARGAGGATPPITSRSSWKRPRLADLQQSQGPKVATVVAGDLVEAPNRSRRRRHE